jgi:hopanoid biosynthesis associated protein HpnK
MSVRESPRRLIVNADDFGRSHAANQAVLLAHREGILTTASLMVNEDGFDEAVAIARENPRLGVGLHLTLLCGKSTLPAEKIPGLITSHGQFSINPARTGFRYFACAALKSQLEAEIGAQFEKFESTGLTLDHVNGHLHLHLHPTILRILIENAERWKIRGMRLTRDRFWLNARLAAGRWVYRISHWLVFGCLAGRAQRVLASHGIVHTRAVFGLLQNGLVDDRYITRLLPCLPPGDSELYSHPSLDKFKDEFDALVNPKTKALVEQSGIRLIRYQDL